VAKRTLYGVKSFKICELKKLAATKLVERDFAFLTRLIFGGARDWKRIMIASAKKRGFERERL